MKKLFCLTAMLLSVSASAFSQNTLTVEDFTLPQTGGTMSVQITLDEAGVYSAYQFDIVTPNGIVYPVDEDGDVDCTLGSGYDSSHSATVHWNPETGLLGVGVISMKSALFKATTLALDIPLAATTAAIGTQLQLTVKDIIIIKQSGEKVSLDDVPFTITIGEADDRVKLDETSTTMPTAAENVNVLVKRTIKANQWSTICLPFDMTAEQVSAAFGDDVELADFSGYEPVEDDGGDIVGITVKLTSANSIEANHPCLIKVASAVTEFSVDNVTIDPEEEPVVAAVKRTRKQWSELIGTYVAQTVVPEKTLFVSDNAFWYSVGATKMKAFRAYFDFYDVLTEVDESYSRVALLFEEETTGIKSIDNGQLTIDNGAVYDLQGRRVAKPSRGLYIMGNKKVLIK